MRAMDIRKLGIRILGVGIAVLLLSSTAAAGTLCSSFASPKDTRLLNSVSSHDGCELGSTQNDSTSQVNADLMFGNSDWSFLTKFESFDSVNMFSDGNGNSVEIDGSTASGSFSITVAAGFEIMMIFKDGEGDPDTYVGYLFQSSTSGTYSTPFVNDSNQAKDISHVSFYIRETGTVSVPEPATLILLGSGLVGLGLWRRRR